MKYQVVPEPVTGYELYPCKGLWSVVVPDGTTNLVINPSVEIEILTLTTGYTAVGGSIARSIAYQRRGAYSLEVTLTAGLNDGVYYASVDLVSGTTYTFSCYVRGRAGVPYQIYIATGAGTALATYRFAGTGSWQRVKVTYTETANAARRLYLTKNGSTDTHIFYTDAWQCEAKAYMTSFCDGDQDGCGWYGVPHASVSMRSPMSREGGRVYRLTEDLHFHVLSYTGLSMPPVENASTPFGLLDGAQFQRATYTPRTIGIAGYVAGRTLEIMQRRKKQLLAALAPDKTMPRQPIRLIYQHKGGEVAVDAVYASGLDGVTDNFHQERIGAQFVAHLPLLFALDTTGTALDYADVITTEYLAGRVGAQWSGLGATCNGQVRCVAVGPDGWVYFGGAFTNMAGVAAADYIAKYNPITGVWAAIGVPGGVGGREIEAIAFGPDGSLYVGGIFTNWAGVADADYIARWDGTNWNAVGDPTQGTAAIIFVYAIAIDNAGVVYVGGDFLNWAGIAAADNMAKWNGIAWTAMGTGVNDIVYALVVDTSNNVYAGGLFTSASGVANTIAAAKWNGTSWVSVNTSPFISVGGPGIYALALTSDGTLYATGWFTQIGGVTASYIARFNGVSWEALGSGINYPGYALAVHPDGSIYVGGTFTSAGGVVLADSLAKWNGTAWTPLDVDLVDAGPQPTIFGMAIAKNGDVFIGFDKTGNSDCAGIMPVNNTGSAEVAPIVQFVGGGTLVSLRNESTRQEILFNLILNVGETVVLDLTPGHVSFTSTYQGGRGVPSGISPAGGPGRGNMYHTLIAGTDTAIWRLTPGINYVTCFIRDTVGTPSVTMWWQNQYHGVDEA